MAITMGEGVRFNIMQLMVDICHIQETAEEGDQYPIEYTIVVDHGDGKAVDYDEFDYYNQVFLSGKDHTVLGVNRLEAAE